ncbi:hypothetical protein V7S43_009783 [Phytophthora oleae]|uniref:BZIP domain-containing protein n=1 Tax=Phytophthora oleae TaxID=2107226 RepID=A0ABD3FHY0_9STRA
MSERGNGIARQHPFCTSITTKVSLSIHQESLSQANTRRKGSNPSLRNLSYRERQRIYKQRYRIKQQAFQDDLEKGNKQLHAEIKQLQVRLERLPYAIIKSPTMWTIATEYFRLFQCGLHIQNETPTAQIDFLQAMIAPGIGAGTVQCVATLVRNWVVFARFFQGIDMQLQRLERVADCTLIARATISVTLSRHSLVNLFPHLFYGGVVRGMQATQSRVYRIAKKLIDQRLVLHGSVRFGWDNLSHRVETLDSEFDMTSPLLQLLGSVEDVAFVFNGALVTSGFNVIAAVSPEMEKDAVNMMEAWA